MNETVAAVVAMAIVLLIMLLYIAIKDKESAKKFAMLEAAIDGMSQEVYKVAKEVRMLKNRVQEIAQAQQDASEAQGADEVSIQLAAQIDALAQKSDHLQHQIDLLLEDISERVAQLDGKVRQVTLLSDRIVPDEQKILQLHAQGLDSETIAKRLRIGKGEVDFALRVARLNG